ncbi:MAG: c-type cytochrome [Gemmataceae bacterium]
MFKLILISTLGLFPVLVDSPVRAAEPAAGTGTGTTTTTSQQPTLDHQAVARGQKALEQTAFIPGFWPPFAYDNAWKTWGLKEKPKDYDAAFRDHYGLSKAPYDNGRYPMGLREAPLLIGKGIGIDCMICHGESIFGKNVPGLGNASLDIHALFEDLYRAGGLKADLPFVFSHVRGTNEAGAFGVYLLGLRKPDLAFKPEMTDLGLKDNACEDVPAWWLLKKKKTMYFTGDTDARSVRAIMQFMMHPLNGPGDFKKHEPAFRDVQQYLFSLKAPRYPFPIDAERSARGKIVYGDYCAKCHGTYGEKETYPNKVIPIEIIGTDPNRFQNISEKYHEAYNASWFARESPAPKIMKESVGYQAPPLDGIWATAPYFHNGSVPTLDGVLNSQKRPTRFTRSYRTDEADYDPVRVGWKVKEVPERDDPKASAFERRKIYDTSRPGRSNRGHTFGDDLTDAERRDLIEYLKTI